MGKLDTHIQHYREVKNNFQFLNSHNDLSNNIRLIAKNKLESFNFTDLKTNADWINPNLQFKSHTDLTRLDLGKVGGQFWAAFVECNSTDPVAETLDQIDVIKRLVRRYPKLVLATKSNGVSGDIYDNVKNLIKNSFLQKSNRHTLNKKSLV